jgi:hypothetical protein
MTFDESVEWPQIALAGTSSELDQFLIADFLMSIQCRLP